MRSPTTASGLSYGNPQRIARINPATNRVVVSRKLDGAALYVGSLLASDGRVLWVVQRDAHLLWRIDPRSGYMLTTGKIGNDTVEDAAVAAGYLWVALETASGVWQVDDRGITIAKVNTGKLPWAVVPVADAVWVSNANGGTVTRIDVATHQTSTSQLGHRPLGMAAHAETMFGSLGVSATDARSVITGSQILTTAVIGDPGASMIDPAGEVTTSSDGPALVYTTGKGSTRYGRCTERVGTGRPGHRCCAADGIPGRVQLLVHGTPRLPILTSFVRRGRDGCGDASLHRAGARPGRLLRLRPRRHQEDRRGREPDRVHPECRDRRPPGTPIASVCDSRPVCTPVVPGGTTQPIASAGPYYVDTHVPGQQIVVLQNLNYVGTRAQQLDAIVIGIWYASDEAVEAVERGDVDLVTASCR